MRRLALLAASALLAFTLSSPAASAPLPSPADVSRGAQVWTPIGPPGSATITSLAIDPERPQIAFATLNDNGIARSEDGGVTWQAANNGLTSPFVTGVVVHPRSSQRVYATNFFGQLVRSDDGGDSWQELAVPGSPGVTLASAPSDPDLVYAGSKAIYVSRNAGTSWVQATGHGLPKSFHVSALAVDAKNPRLLYAAIGSSSLFGLWASVDAGATWARRLHAVPTTLVCDPVRSGMVYLIQEGRVQRSRDQGVTWEPYFSTSFANVLSFDPQQPWIAYIANDNPPAPLYRTTDDGGHWTAVNEGLPNFFAAATLAAGPGGRVLFGSFEPGTFFRSADEGTTWAVTGTDLINTSVANVAFGPPGVLLASVGKDLERTVDGGATWSSVLTVGSGISVLAVDPQQRSTIYAGSFLISGIAPAVVWKSTDAGLSWSALPYPQAAAAPYSGIQVADLAVDPTNSQVVYLASENGEIGAVNGQGVYRSADSGETWVKTSLPALDFCCLALSRDRPGEVWAMTFEDAYKSVDSGQTWQTVLHSPIGRPLRAIAIAPSNPDVVWAVGDYDTFRSLDGGASWQHLAGIIRPPSFAFGEFPHPLAVDPNDPATIYLAWDDGVSRRSLGTRWQSISQGMLDHFAAALCFDPTDPTRVVVGTNGGGVYETTLAPAP